jgi:hypothetical protein
MVAVGHHQACCDKRSQKAQYIRFIEVRIWEPLVQMANDRRKRPELVAMLIGSTLQPGKPRRSHNCIRPGIRQLE